MTSIIDRPQLVYQGCLEERKATYGCHMFYKDVSPMLCHTQSDLCVTCIDDDYIKDPFSSLPIVFGGQVGKLEIFFEDGRGYGLDDSITCRCK